MEEVLSELESMSQIVVVDTTPLLNVSDALPLLDLVSGVVLVAKLGATSRDALIRTRQVLETGKASVLGVVATGSAAAGLYGYGTEYYEADYEEVKREAVAGKALREPRCRIRRCAHGAPGTNHQQSAPIPEAILPHAAAAIDGEAPAPNSEAILHTNAGAVSVELFDGDAPKTVESFRKLAGQGFYDGVSFHRVINDFMIQGGHPKDSDGAGLATPVRR